MVKVFKWLDRDEDGFIGSKDLKKSPLLLGDKLTDYQVSEIISEFDLDRDGKLSLEEFANWYVQGREQETGPQR